MSFTFDIDAAKQRTMAKTAKTANPAPKEADFSRISHFSQGSGEKSEVEQWNTKTIHIKRDDGRVDDWFVMTRSDGRLVRFWSLKDRESGATVPHVPDIESTPQDASSDSGGGAQSRTEKEENLQPIRSKNDAA